MIGSMALVVDDDDDDDDGRGDAVAESEKVETLRGVLGSAMPVDDLRSLLRSSNGDVERALNRYFHSEAGRARAARRARLAPSVA